MKIGGVYHAKLARARLVSQARMQSGARARKFTSGRVNVGSSGSYMNKLKNSLSPSQKSGSASSVNTLLKRSNYNALLNASESIQKHGKTLTETGEKALFESEESRTQAIQEIKGFLQDYNNMIERLTKVDSTVSKLYVKQLSGHVADNQDDLRELGITRSTTGTLKLDEEKLAKADLEKLKKVFGTSGGFITKICSWAEKIEANAEANLSGMYQSENLYGNNYNRYGTNINGYSGSFNTRG